MLPPSLLRARRALTLLCIPLAPSVMGDPQESLSLDRFPPAIVERLLTDFETHKQALETEGFPTTLEELAAWNVCGEDQTNAFELYKSAFTEDLAPSARRKLIEAAAVETCFHYPISTRKWTWFSESEPDMTSGMRDASRIMANEIVIQLALRNIHASVAQAESALAMLGHLAKCPKLVEQLAFYACQPLILASVEDLLASPALTESHLVILDTALTRAIDPARLARTWLAERALYGDPDPFSVTPIVHVYDARARARLLSVRAAVAVERYRLAHGQLPDTLDVLVPGQLSAIPTDPFTGQPLRYIVSADHYAIFSVDADGEPCSDIAGASLNSEPTLVRLPVVKREQPLSELSYAMPDSGGKNSRAEIKAMQSVGTIVGEATRGSGTFTVMLSAGTLDAGIAVMVNAFSYVQPVYRERPVLAVFWVKDGTISTVNSWARELAPDLPAAPETITFDRARDVVR